MYYLQTRSDELYHYGILGMKWGVRRYQNPDGSYTAEGRERYKVPLSTKMTAKKDAKEYARSRMFYGEGAGTRRKLINAKVKQRSIDPAYKEQFDYYMSKQDMAKHASKARGERHRKDIVKGTAKTARGIRNIAVGNIAYAFTGAILVYGVAKYTGLDKVVAQYAKTAASKAVQIAKQKKYQHVINQAFHAAGKA